MNNTVDFYKKFEEKVTEQDIDIFVDEFYTAFRSKKYSRYVFDISDVEWISNQELLVFTGLLQYLVVIGEQFFVHFLGSKQLPKISKRKAKQFVEIWEVWKIYQIVPHQNYYLHFDLDGNQIQRFKKQFNITSENSEIYDRYGVTPFITLDYVKAYSDRKISDLLSEIYKLNSATSDILELNNCSLPFENQTLNSIITKELYENFLDHFQSSFFGASDEFAFMSLSLKARFNEIFYTDGKIQSMLQGNFNDEMISEVEGFYKDAKTGKWRNRSVLHLSFVDFGVGIPNTLREEFKSGNPDYSEGKLANAGVDSRILRFAFEANSSKHPISQKYLDKLSVPRGLFDLLTIVKRFEGLLVARSNFGKILFDFSNGQSIEQALGVFGDERLFFPGTLISIYVPERLSTAEIEGSVIKQLIDLDKFSFFNKKTAYISVFDVQKDIQGFQHKENIYNELFENLVNRITGIEENSLIYIDFAGYQIDERISKKIIYFLVSDYSINLSRNVIVINPPPLEFLRHIKDEIYYLGEIDRKYRIHPTPFIFLDKEADLLNVFWMGVYSDKDIVKLNNLLMDDHDLRKTDFQFPDDVIGHVNYYDSQGNLKSLIDRVEILGQLERAGQKPIRHALSVYNDRVEESRAIEIQKLVAQSTIVGNKSVFLCSGNYYQYEYIQMYNILVDEANCEYISTSLFDIVRTRVEGQDVKYISISPSSQKMVRYLVAAGLVDINKTIMVSNHQSFVSEHAFQDNIKAGDKFVLICDVISTGYLADFLDRYLISREAELAYVAVVVDSRDPDFENEKYDSVGLKDKVGSLIKKPIKKIRRAQIRNELRKKLLEVIRINPYTNAPIALSIESSNQKGSILLSNEDFIRLLPEESVKTGYFKFNNLIHPYFFDLKNVLKDPKLCKSVLSEIFAKIDIGFLQRLNIVFYPKGSAATQIDTDILTIDILKNNSIKVYELERFQTNEGWRFPDSPLFLKEISEGKVVMILDDGSCTGDSIIQMIDEIAFLDVEEILVLSIIGRVSHHKREFFSRLRTIKGSTKKVKVRTLFACHWHIPTYHIEESPVVKESNWVAEVINLPNTPLRIVEEAKKVLEELSLKQIDHPSNKYLVKNHDKSSIIKELILIKDEIGKIATYKYYREHFDFFDDFIIKYEVKAKSPEDYKTIELICAVFLHEPYLYNKVKSVLPDLAERLESFIIAIVFGNPDGTPRITKRDLFYKWHNKNLFHLLFIFFQGKAFIEMLNTDRFFYLIKQYQGLSDLNYFFLKLLKFIPIDVNELDQKKFGGKIKMLIEAAIENPDLSVEKSQLKIYRAFISTLPSTETNFDDLITKIKLNYAKVLDDDSHNEYIYNDKQIINTQLKVLNKKRLDGEDFEDEIVIIQNSWASISLFIEDLLNLSIQYPKFFLPYKEEIYDNLERINISLRKMHAQLRDYIYDRDFSDVMVISAQLDKIFDRFIMSKSAYTEIFGSITTPNILIEFEAFVKKIQETFPGVTLNTNYPNPSAIAFPKIYLHHIIFKELKENLRHADINRGITIFWSDSKTHLCFKMTNFIKLGSERKGGGKGLARLNNLNEFPVEMYHRASYAEDLYFHEIKFYKL